ncbi:restriction endonuclease subunit S [Metamycoplasma buccale]|uniref:restriction endonuclease subunit S n=1 Tax=Metamycoplasma buccale TaxID=55602 RepID=UPI00398F8790
MTNIINKKIPNVPALRFPEFKDIYVFTNFSSIFSLYNSLSDKNYEDFKSEKSNSEYITYLNVFENVIINVKRNEKVYIDELEKQNKVRCGDIFITQSSETPKEVAFSSVLLDNINSCYLNSFCFGMRPIKMLNSLYFSYMIRSPLLRRRIFPLAQGITRFNLNKVHFFEKMNIIIPNLNEQTKIANFLSLIDKQIELQNKIIKEYKLLKKGIINNIFNFFINNKKNSEYNFQQIFKKYKRVNNNVYSQFTIGKNGLKLILDEKIKYQLDKHIIFDPNSCIFGLGIDEIGISINETGCCSPVYKTYFINQKILNSFFIKLFINKYLNNIKRYITRKSTRRNFEIDYKELIKTKFTIPNFYYQSKYSNICISLENQISLMLNIHKNLLKFKHNLLVKMFI